MDLDLARLFASHLEALQTLCLALNICYALRILAMPLMRILLLARALQLSALRMFATLPDWPVCWPFGKYLLLGEGKVLGLLLGCRRSHVHPVRGPSALPSTLLGKGSGWLPLSGLPWIPASLAGITHGST